MSFDLFENDKKTVQAVIRSLEIVGKTANHIPQEFRENYSDIPWKQMISMRNKVLHEYFGVDTEILWQTISEDLLPLKRKIKSLIVIRTNFSISEILNTFVALSASKFRMTQIRWFEMSSCCLIFFTLFLPISYFPKGEGWIK